MKRVVWRGSAPRLLLILLMSVIATSCSYSRLPAVGSLVPASPQQFIPGIGVVVASGTSGQEISNGQPFWWLIAPEAELTVVNNSSSSADLVVTAVVQPPPCPGDTATVRFSPSNGSPATVVAGPGGANVQLEVQVPAGSTVPIEVAISSRPCQLTTESRTFYAGLFTLRAQPK